MNGKPANVANNNPLKFESFKNIKLGKNAAIVWIVKMRYNLVLACSRGIMGKEVRTD